MVHHMTAPEKVNLVAHTMSPVVGEIYEQKQDHPVPPGCPVRCKEGEIGKKDFVNADAEYF